MRPQVRIFLVYLFTIASAHARWRVNVALSGDGRQREWNEQRRVDGAGALSHRAVASDRQPTSRRPTSSDALIRRQTTARQALSLGLHSLWPPYVIGQAIIFLPCRPSGVVLQDHVVCCSSSDVGHSWKGRRITCSFS